MTVALFLPGIATPARVAFAPLLARLDPSVHAVTKELEVYAGDTPPESYDLQAEVDGLDRFVTDRGYHRFHLYGHSIGGAIALAYTARNGDRVTSLALNEAATDFSTEDRAVIASQRLGELPDDQRMAAFVRQLLRPGVEIGASPATPPTAESAKRPAGLAAAIAAIEAATLDDAPLRAYARPVYYSYGSLSNARWEAMGTRLTTVFPDCTVEEYEGRHHLDPSHQAEPARVAAALHRLWRRA
jgi:pimeloyl-ACP methyl ester carboxylesterase